MATNYISSGDTVTLTAPYAVASGAGVLVGSLFGVATATAAISTAVEAKTSGVFLLAKTSAQAWTVGAKVYWDDTAKVVTTTSTDNTLIGCAMAVAANPSSTGYVRLNGTV
jgi:predicted RecA/RadA family phage recombinase